MRNAMGVLGLALIMAPAAVTPQPADTGSFEQGQALYQAHCALCHLDSGAGNPPMFSALDANELLADTTLVVGRIRQGAGAMPPFPDLGAQDIAAVATYVRNAWTNAFGGVTVEDVAAALAGLEDGGELASVWDGVFTEAQAQRGQALYPGPCGLCHGRRLDGAPDDPDMRATPPLARARFLRIWEGRSLATLFEYTRATMPEGNPASLADQEYVDVIAYMLSVGGLPAGDEELPADAQRLSRIVIRQAAP